VDDYLTYLLSARKLGMTPIDYLNRLSSAAGAAAPARGPNQSITTIALEVWVFSSSSLFQPNVPTADRSIS
jgi:hypothetical protein